MRKPKLSKCLAIFLIVLACAFLVLVFVGKIKYKIGDVKCYSNGDKEVSKITKGLLDVKLK